MRLDRLELENFKSYGGHCVIGPFTAFSAVIGPNGSGKSNLMDAISFVLGVRARELRGAQLKDLIYSSDSATKGKLRAKVSAVFVDANDEDADELILSRSISAKGSSDYKINGKAVTWEQYDERLQSLGLLVKAKNFLVFQGDVENIAAKSPKQLTQLFEQISGSAALRDEYEAAKKARDEAEADHLFFQQQKKGLYTERKQYQQQKEEADRFQQLQDELAATRREHILWQLYNIEQDMTEESDALQTKLKTFNKLTRKGEAAKATLKDHNKKVAAAAKARMNAKKDLKNQEKKVHKLTPQHVAIQTKLKHAKGRLAANAKLLQSARADQQRADEEVHELQDELEKVEAAQERYDNTLAEESQHDEIQLGQEEMEMYNQLKAKAASETHDLKTTCDKATRLYEAKQREVQREQKQKEEIKTKMAALEKEIATQSERLKRLQENLNRQQKDMQQKERDVQRAKQERQEMTQQKGELSSKIETVKASLREANAYRKESARNRRLNDAIATMKQLFPGVHGKMIDLCEPRHSRYKVAVTVIMGSNMDAVVVDSSDVAMECLKYLRENQIGTATFIPLESVKVKDVKEHLRQLPNGSKLVRDVIDFPPRIERAVQYACGNAVVCETEKEAKRLVFSEGAASKTVSLKGTVIKASGEMQGGLAGVEMKAKRWDEKNVDELRVQLSQLETKYKAVARKRVPDTGEDEAQIEGLKSLCKTVSHHIDLTQSTLASREKDLKALRSALKTTEDKLAAAEQELEQLRAQHEAAQQKFNEATDAIFASFCRRVKLQNIREYEDTRLARAEQMANRKKEFAKQITALKATLDFEKKTASGFADRVASLEQKHEELENEKEKQEKALEKLGKDLDRETKRRDELLAIVKEKQEAEAELAAEMKELQSKIRENAQHRAEAQKDLTNSRTRLDKLCARRHQHYKYCKVNGIPLPFASGGFKQVQDEEEVPAISTDVSMSTSYTSIEGNSINTDVAQRLYAKEAEIELTFDELPEDLLDVPEEDRDAVSREFVDRMQKTQAELEHIAPNMRAVERLADVRERLQQSATSFQETLERSTKAADAFEEIRAERCRLFRDAFDHVQNDIKTIYKALTESPSAPAGGTAYLSLENSDDPFLGGVKYNAMPPLKRFRDMEQLSGGEKTVAALALLFALHSYKPAPFFILDEIDAALDNQNVNRVVRYIRRRTGAHFQCIVISLKDTFFSHAESLVGIYRDPKQQCSRTLTVDLTQYPEEHQA
ncbi:hypothetical protein PTSG_07521 [Salpingoeca rosetta]|uniref:Structural maintenance of chromosomes protein n=1 Tax=Salpingoeca rosetta (strain ATCC 50818 / BSB-021) TaxID=946362 RepID=F2UH03_SALR5|nr:uncharacterized protein PTSG_07521 [Salpingoeca rosetta]EGD76402.1 hypothetical protein PTSG_07521 [Salpingoeca rosetta]|eukprot:XP_004991317.1 hypothetical protein PTSG_07521 [Salpingoeca rosetta]